MARKKTFNQEELYEATKEIMLEVGYEIFSFQLLADRLHITRTALYKHYRNKQDLLQAFLNDSMDAFVHRLTTRDWELSYPQKLDALINLVFDFTDTHKISSMVPTQPWSEANAEDEEVKKSKELHTQFFGFIQDLILEGQQEGYLKASIPSALIIETIFHSITLPNRMGLSSVDRAKFVKEMLFHGILTNEEKW